MIIIMNRKKEKYDSEYAKYMEKALKGMEEEELYKDIGTTRDILNSFVDRTAKRSLYLYRNNNCHTCALLLAKGKSTSKCPKCHSRLNALFQ